MKIKVLSLIIFFTIFISCNKNDELLNTSCEEIPPLSIITSWGEYQFTAIFPNYNLPCFNPNNPDEIILRRYGGGGDSVLQLVKYSLSTKEQETIFEGNFGPRPRWSRKGWILLNMRDFNIYKIKSNGDSLTQLTFGSAICLGGEWNWQGDKFIYNLVGADGNSMIICKENGIVIDTLEKGTGAITPSWQQNSLIVNSHHGGVSIYDPILNEFQQIRFEDGRDLSDWTSAEWLDHENLIWSNSEGIFKANIVTEQIIQIKESCNSQIYRYPTVSQISKKIIFTRDDKTVTDKSKGLGFFESKLFMMNYDGTEEKIIELD